MRAFVHLVRASIQRPESVFVRSLFSQTRHTQPLSRLTRSPPTWHRLRSTSSQHGPINVHFTSGQPTSRAQEILYYFAIGGVVGGLAIVGVVYYKWLALKRQVSDAAINAYETLSAGASQLGGMVGAGTASTKRVLNEAKDSDALQTVVTSTKRVMNEAKISDSLQSTVASAKRVLGEAKDSDALAKRVLDNRAVADACQALKDLFTPRDK